MKNKFSLLIATGLMALCIDNVSFAQLRPPNLKAAADFVLFTGSGQVNNTGTSQITGKIGTNGGGTITGFTSVPGQQESANALTAQAATDLETAYNYLFNAAPTAPPHGTVFGNNETITPGVYSTTAASSIQGNLILDAQGDPDAVFIFKIGGAFTANPSSQISLLGNATACNIFWAVEGGEIIIGTQCEMKGTFIAHPGAFSMAASSTLIGRGLSSAGAIGVNEVTASLPTNCTTVLPVVLISFTATCNQPYVELKWATAAETNNSFFTVERSVEALTWQVVGSVDGARGTSRVNKYALTDKFPGKGTSFYRLKQTDLDGKYKYWDVIAAKSCGTKSEERLSIYPNPSSGKFNLLLTSEPGRVTSIEIFDALGHKVEGSTGFQPMFDLSGKAPGVYHVRIHTNAGIINRKIILKR